MISFLGPPLEEGPLPALFYFALSKEASLYQDPYNQPVVHLQSKKIRLFSLSLPFHGPDLNPAEGVGNWAKSFEKGNDPLTPFFDQILAMIQELIQKGYILSERIGLMGLSRGGLVAGHLAIRLPIVAWVAFAPLTKLTKAREFAALQEKFLIKNFNLENLVPTLASIPVRFYIGNRDTRVGTRNCFELIEALSNKAFELGLRSPPIELIISPSIGQMGHGTSKENFHSGANWIADRLGVL